MAMNTGKIVVGGLVAGLVMNVLDYAINTFIMAEQMKAAMDALNPSLAANMAKTSTIVTWVVVDFIWGFLLVWTYAAIRPRFGPGPKTASYVGLVFWGLGGTMYAGFTAMGMFPWSSFPLGAGLALVNMLASANAGAALYKE